MASERNQQPVKVQEGYQPRTKGYQPTGQRGYQPQSSRPIDPMKLTPPKGGSAVQPPQAQNGQAKK